MVREVEVPAEAEENTFINPNTLLSAYVPTSAFAQPAPISPFPCGDDGELKCHEPRLRATLRRKSLNLRYVQRYFVTEGDSIR